MMAAAAGIADDSVVGGVAVGPKLRFERDSTRKAHHREERRVVDRAS
jgi:hypothetical protein